MGLALASNAIDNTYEVRLHQLLLQQLELLEGEVARAHYPLESENYAATLGVFTTDGYGQPVNQQNPVHHLTFSPLKKTDDIFSRLHQRIYHTLMQQHDEAHQQRHNIVAIGSLPTHRHQQSNALFRFSHSVSVSDFTAYYNAAQLSCSLTLAIAANSPHLSVKPSWDEAHVALHSPHGNHQDSGIESIEHPPIIFGQDWLSHGITELYRQSVHSAVMPSMADLTSMTLSRELTTPALTHGSVLFQHHNNILRWNRATVSPINQQITIEYNAIPAGPSTADSIANAMLQLGLTLYLAQHNAWFTHIVPFNTAETNFYRCAECGLQAEIAWPNAETGEISQQRVLYVLADLLPHIRRTLLEHRFSAYDIDGYMGIIEKRLLTRQTGATWQRQHYRKLITQYKATEALELVTRDYLSYAHTDVPVAEWN